MTGLVRPVQMRREGAVGVSSRESGPEGRPGAVLLNKAVGETGPPPLSGQRAHRGAFPPCEFRWYHGARLRPMKGRIGPALFFYSEYFITLKRDKALGSAAHRLAAFPRKRRLRSNPVLGELTSPKDTPTRAASVRNRGYRVAAASGAHTGAAARIRGGLDTLWRIRN